jgi:2'-5' RNA ligase
LFVAAWPTPEVLAGLARLPRPELPSVRWVPLEQLHVTLRFLGEVDEAVATSVEARLRAVAGARPRPRAVVATTPRRLGTRVAALPVTGVDEVAAAVIDATREVGRPVGRRTFRAHLTVARLGPGHPPLPRSVRLDEPLAWPLDALALVRSRQAPGGVAYDRLATLALDG